MTHSQNVFSQHVDNQFTLTETARSKMQTLLKDEPETRAVRIFVSGGGCSGMRYGMRFDDKTTEYDALLKEDGIRIVTDAVALGYLAGVAIDFVESSTNTSFVFNNAFQVTGDSGGCSGCASSG